MIMTYLIIGLFLILVGSAIILVVSEKKAVFAYVGIVLCLIGLGCIVHSRPQAIDVYRGKTTLQITYKDSIPVDSVVVFK